RAATAGVPATDVVMFGTNDQRDVCNTRLGQFVENVVEKRAAGFPAGAAHRHHGLEAGGGGRGLLVGQRGGRGAGAHAAAHPARHRDSYHGSTNTYRISRASGMGAPPASTSNTMATRGSPSRAEPVPNNVA